MQPPAVLPIYPTRRNAGGTLGKGARRLKVLNELWPNLRVLPLTDRHKGEPAEKHAPGSETSQTSGSAKTHARRTGLISHASILTDKFGRPLKLIANRKDEVHDPPVMTEDELAKILARHCHRPVSAARKSIEDLRNGAAYETTTRHPKEYGDDLDLTPEQVAKVIATSPLGRLQQRYEKLLKIKLPPDGLNLKQARLASNLVTTFQNLQKCRRELGLEPLEKDQKVIDAERLRTAFYSKARKKQATDEPARRDRAKPSPQTSLHR